MLDNITRLDLYKSLLSSRHGAAPHADLITDVEPDDVIDLSQIDAGTTRKNEQAFHLVGSFVHHAGELVVS